MDALWLASAVNLREQLARGAKSKEKEIRIEVSTTVLEEGKEFEPEPLWVHYLLEHSWPEDF